MVRIIRVLSWPAVSTLVTGAFGRIRPATPDDATAICRIYNQGIEDRVATLETELRTASTRWCCPRFPPTRAA